MRIRCFTIPRIQKYSIHHTFIEFIILLYSFLVISFVQYKEYMIWQISFSKFSDVLTALTCTRAMGKLWSICLRVNIWAAYRDFTFRDLSSMQATRARRTKSKGWPFPCVCFYWKCSNFKAIKNSFCLTLRSLFVFSKVKNFVFYLRFLVLYSLHWLFVLFPQFCLIPIQLLQLKTLLKTKRPSIFWYVTKICF